MRTLILIFFLAGQLGSPARAEVSYRTTSLGLANNRYLTTRQPLPPLVGLKRFRRWAPGVRFVSATFSPNGRGLALVSVTQGRTLLHVWDVQTGAELVRLAPPASWGRVTQIALSPDLRRLAVGFAKSEARIFDTLSGRVVAQPSASTPLGYTPDGRWLLLASGRELTCWSPSVARSSPQAAAVDGTLAFSADGSTGAFISSQGGWWHSALTFFDAATCDRFRSFPAGQQLISLGFSPDGAELISINSEHDQFDRWNPGSGKFSRLPWISSQENCGRASPVDRTHLLMICEPSADAEAAYRPDDYGAWELELWDISGAPKRRYRIHQDDFYFRAMEFGTYSATGKSAVFFGKTGYERDPNELILIELDAGNLLGAKGDFALPSRDAAAPGSPSTASVLILAEENSAEAAATLPIFPRAQVVSPENIASNPSVLVGTDVVYVGTTALANRARLPEIERLMSGYRNWIIASPLANQFQGPIKKEIHMVGWGEQWRAQGEDLRLMRENSIGPDEQVWSAHPHYLRTPEDFLYLGFSLTSESYSPMYLFPAGEHTFSEEWSHCTEVIRLGAYPGAWRCRRANGGIVILSGFEWGDIRLPKSDPDVLRDWFEDLLSDR